MLTKFGILKKGLACGLATVVVLCCALTTANAQIVYTESFEYADQPALAAEWPRTDPPFGPVPGGALWQNEVQLDTGNASDGAKSAQFNGGTILADFSSGVEGNAGLNANLGIGVPVTKVSWDSYVNLGPIGGGPDGTVIVQLEQTDATYLGSLFTNPGSLEVNFASQGAAVITPLGISLKDEEWNSLEWTFAANGDSNFSVTNSDGTSASAYTATDVPSNLVNRILMFDNITFDAAPNNGGRIDNIVVMGVPEPTSMALAGLGCVFTLLASGRRRK